MTVDTAHQTLISHSHGAETQLKDMTQKPKEGLWGKKKKNK